MTSDEQNYFSKREAARSGDIKIAEGAEGAAEEIEDAEITEGIEGNF